MTNIESNKNPFIIGHPAKGSDFFGRKDLLCSVKSFLQSDSIHLFLSGQRRVGKTSLLQNIRDNFKNNTTGIVYINLQTSISSRLETLLKRLVSKIAGKLKFDTGKINFEDLEINFEDILIEILKSDTEKTEQETAEGIEPRPEEGEKEQLLWEEEEAEKPEQMNEAGEEEEKKEEETDKFWGKDEAKEDEQNEKDRSEEGKKKDRK